MHVVLRFNYFIDESFVIRAENGAESLSHLQPHDSDLLDGAIAYNLLLLSFLSLAANLIVRVELLDFVMHSIGSIEKPYSLLSYSVMNCLN